MLPLFAILFALEDAHILKCDCEYCRSTSFRVQTYEIQIRIIYEDHRKFNTYFVREFFALKDLYILRFNCEYCRSAPLRVDPIKTGLGLIMA